MFWGCFRHIINISFSDKQQQRVSLYLYTLLSTHLLYFYFVLFENGKKIKIDLNYSHLGAVVCVVRYYFCGSVVVVVGVVGGNNKFQKQFFSFSLTLLLLFWLQCVCVCLAFAHVAQVQGFWSSAYLYTQSLCNECRQKLCNCVARWATQRQIIEINN